MSILFECFRAFVIDTRKHHKTRENTAHSCVYESLRTHVIFDYESSALTVELRSLCETAGLDVVDAERQPSIETASKSEKDSAVAVGVGVLGMRPMRLSKSIVTHWVDFQKGGTNHSSNARS